MIVFFITTSDWPVLVSIRIYISVDSEEPILVEIECLMYLFSDIEFTVVHYCVLIIDLYSWRISSGM